MKMQTVSLNLIAYKFFHIIYMKDFQRILVIFER